MTSQALEVHMAWSTVEKFLRSFTSGPLVLGHTRAPRSSPDTCGICTKEVLCATERPSVLSGPVAIKVVDPSLLEVCQISGNAHFTWRR